jgi:hypothetical protein
MRGGAAALRLLKSCAQTYGAFGPGHFHGFRVSRAMQACGCSDFPLPTGPLLLGLHRRSRMIG